MGTSRTIVRLSSTLVSEPDKLYTKEVARESHESGTELESIHN